MTINSEQELRDLYGHPKGRAVKKALRSLEKHTVQFIETSPFILLASYDSIGKVDVSPKGGKKGFVRVLDEKTIILPDSKGNNRLDGLVNIIETGRIGMLFIIPGIDETLRVNGSAEISTDSNLLDLFKDEQNPPLTCLIIHIEELFMHCAKAFMRSELWSIDTQVERSTFPSMGRILKDQIGSDDKIESQEEMRQRYQKDL